MKSNLKVLLLALAFTITCTLMMSCGLLLLPFTVEEVLPYGVDLPDIEGLFANDAQKSPLSQKELKEKFTPYTHTVYLGDGADVSFFTAEEYAELEKAKENGGRGLSLEELLYLLSDSFTLYKNAQTISLYGRDRPIVPPKNYMDLPYTASFEAYGHIKREILLISAYRIAAFDDRLVFFDKEGEVCPMDSLFEKEDQLSHCAILLDEPMNEGYIRKLKEATEVIKIEEGRLLLFDFEGRVEIHGDGSSVNLFEAMAEDLRPYEDERFDSSRSSGITLSYWEMDGQSPRFMWEKEVPKEDLAPYYDALNEREYLIPPELGTDFESYGGYYVADLQNGICIWIPADLKDLEHRQESVLCMILNKDVIPETVYLGDYASLNLARLIYGCMEERN